MTRMAMLALLLAWPATASAQRSSAIRRLETAAWTHIAARVRLARALSVESGQLDLRLPLGGGEAEVVRGAMSHARDALAIAMIRLEPSDSAGGSREEGFTSGRYDIRLEDRAGNCVAVHQDVRVVGDSAIERGARMVEQCRPLLMADVVRRARRIVRLPLSAGDVTDHWTVAPALAGFADVYADSVVIVANTLALRASYPPDTAAMRVDSVAVGLALGEGQWNIVHRSAALAVDTTLRLGGTWSRRGLRFTIPIDSTFALTESWPVVEVVLRVAKTEDNPVGLAWTYAHARKPFFGGVKR
jgi:hypothetical protein